MIESMTGFGRGTAEKGGVTATAEMRSVNKRFVEVSIRLPRLLAAREAAMQALVKERFERGRITVQIQLEEVPGEETLPIRVDEAAARAYADLLGDLRAAAGIEAPVQLEHLLTFSDVFTSIEKDDVEAGQQEEAAWQAAQAALERAARALRRMRREEGRALHADLSARLDALEAALGKVEARAPERVAEARRRLRERLTELFNDERLEADRLEAEVAFLADKLDVTEECVRLRSHLGQFRTALDAEGEAVGRRLKFLVQEIHREVNTISSKANDAEVAQHAVGMKEEVEKIREQVANVE